MRRPHSGRGRQAERQVLRRDVQRGGGPGGRWWSSTSMQALRMVWRAEGGAARRLWSGYTALAARNLPFTALQFPIFEFVRGRVRESRGRRRTEQELDSGSGTASGTSSRRLAETWLVNGASAAFAGAVAAVLTTPTDVVKTRMMLAAGAGGGGDDSKTKDPTPISSKEAKIEMKIGTSSSGLQVARQVFHEQGVKGLFRGGILRAMWTALGSGIYLGSYEVAKVWLKQRNSENDSRVM